MCFFKNFIFVFINKCPQVPKAIFIPKRKVVGYQTTEQKVHSGTRKIRPKAGLEKMTSAAATLLVFLAQANAEAEATQKNYTVNPEKRYRALEKLKTF